MMNNIKGFLETSFIDWPGRVCAVLFLGGCNFRCDFCHNHQLVVDPHGLESFGLSEVLGQLVSMRPWLGGVCITGGEPTLDPELVDLIKILGRHGFAVKLDTNGSRPLTLKKLLDEDLLAMVAMDVKAPLDPVKYQRCCGVEVDLGRIKQSIELIIDSGVAHQFRMTVVPGYHELEDIMSWRRIFPPGTGLKLQNYRPSSVLAPERAGVSGFKPDDFSEMESCLTL